MYTSRPAKGLRSVQTAEFDVYGDGVGRRDDCVWPTSNYTYINVYLLAVVLRDEDSN